MNRGGAEREGDTESETGPRLWAVSTQPDVGLELTDHKIMTWVEVGCLTNRVTQAPLDWFLKYWFPGLTFGHSDSICLRLGNLFFFFLIKNFLGGSHIADPWTSPWVFLDCFKLTSKQPKSRGTWVAQSVKCLTWAQVMISQLWVQSPPWVLHWQCGACFTFPLFLSLSPLPLLHLCSPS